MQKEVDIKAVIGFSGTLQLIQAMFTTGSCSTLTTSTLYTPWDQQS